MREYSVEYCESHIVKKGRTGRVSMERGAAGRPAQKKTFQASPSLVSRLGSLLAAQILLAAAAGLLVRRSPSFCGRFEDRSPSGQLLDCLLQKITFCLVTYILRIAWFGDECGKRDIIEFSLRCRPMVACRLKFLCTHAVAVVVFLSFCTRAMWDSLWRVLLLQQQHLIVLFSSLNTALASSFHSVVHSFIRVFKVDEQLTVRKIT